MCSLNGTAGTCPRSHGRFRAAVWSAPKQSRTAPSGPASPILYVAPRLNKCSRATRAEDQAEQVQGSTAEGEQQQRHAIWCQGLFRGTFFQEVQSEFPAVTWQTSSLLKVLYYGVPAAAAAIFSQNILAAYMTASTTAASLSSATAAAAAAADEPVAAWLAEPLHQQALLHLSQESLLSAALPTACYVALGPRVTSARWDAYWIGQTLATCVILFPLVDPLLSEIWRPAVTAVLGPTPDIALVTTLQQVGITSDWSSLGLHCLASGVFGPVWEEVFWRGFFLTALTKVLPLAPCLAISSLNFAVLHLSPHNFLPLLVLSACCDCLYLRSGGNLSAPVLLHGLWNCSQVLQIALLHKAFFV